MMEKRINRTATYQGSVHSWNGCPLLADDYEDQIIDFCEGKKSLWTLMFNDNNNVRHAVVSGLSKGNTTPLQLSGKGRNNKRSVVAVGERWSYEAEAIRKYLSGGIVYYKSKDGVWRIAEGNIRLLPTTILTAHVTDVFLAEYDVITHTPLDERLPEKVVRANIPKIRAKDKPIIEEHFKTQLEQAKKGKAVEASWKKIGEVSLSGPETKVIAGAECEVAKLIYYSPTPDTLGRTEVVLNFYDVDGASKIRHGLSRNGQTRMKVDFSNV